MGRYKWDYALRRRDLDRSCRIPIVLYVIPMKWKEGYIYINCFKMKLKSEAQKRRLDQEIYEHRLVRWDH